MKMVRIMVQVPRTLKTKLDELRRQGTTASGLLRSLLERELNQPQQPPTGRKGR